MTHRALKSPYSLRKFIWTRVKWTIELCVLTGKIMNFSLWVASRKLFHKFTKYFKKNRDKVRAREKPKKSYLTYPRAIILDTKIFWQRIGITYLVGRKLKMGHFWFLFSMDLIFLYLCNFIHRRYATFNFVQKQLN